MGGEWALGVALVMEVWPDQSRAWMAGWIGAFGNIGYTICGGILILLNRIGPKLPQYLSDVGLPNSLLRHGVKREVFIYRLVDELAAGMAGNGFGAPYLLSTSEFSDFWKARWAVPRAGRFPNWNTGRDVELLASKVEYWAALRP